MSLKTAQERENNLKRPAASKITDRLLEVDKINNQKTQESSEWGTVMSTASAYTIAAPQRGQAAI